MNILEEASRELAERLVNNRQPFALKEGREEQRRTEHR